LALTLTDLLLNLLVNFRTQFQNFQFLGEFTDQGLEPLAYVCCFQEFLPQKGRKGGQRAGDEVRQAPRIFDIRGHGLQVVRKLWRMADHIAEEVLRISLEQDLRYSRPRIAGRPKAVENG